MSSRTTPNFCSRCGARLRAGDTYCSECGAVADGSRARRYGPRVGDTPNGFRRRVEGLTAEGWEVQRDDGDRAILVNRGVGSIGVHVLLLLFTGGLGNLLYGGYCYWMKAERIELRSDGTRRWLKRETGASTTEIDPETMNWTFSVVAASFLLFLGVTFVASGASMIAVAIGLACLVGAVLVLPPVRRRLAARRSIDTFGRVRETDERVVERPETPCAACAAPVDRGVERRYGERTCVAGIPIRVHEHGRNVYCQDCASGRSFEESATEPATRNELA